MNAVQKQVNGLRPLTGFLPSHLRALAANPAPMPDEVPDADILKMAEWYAAQSWGQLAINSDSQEHGWQS